MRVLSAMVLCVCVSVSALAQEVQVIGSIDRPITVSPATRFAAPVIKQITLLRIALSAKARHTFRNRLEQVQQSAPHTLGMTSVQLGMGRVPVLDQGGHGTCVTFANTAAIDAVLDRGDYISQLCLLQLGQYIENNGYNPSGWEGALGGAVLSQMDAYGIVSKANQTAVGCGGLTQYPAGGQSKTDMTPEAYHQIASALNNTRVAWSSMLDSYQAVLDSVNMDDMLMLVKKSLNAGDRLTFGVLLPASTEGIAGAVGRYKASYDSWILTPEIVEGMASETDLPGHEMIITGYDDAAVAVDAKGQTHQGLLTLRNSWGERVGDHGDFYMSYAYFKALVLEIQRIRQLS